MRLVVWLLCGALGLGAVTREECFPVERLTPEDRRKSDEWLLKSLDEVSLFTFIGGLKPMSISFTTVTLDLNNGDPEPAEQLRRIAAAWRCGEELLTDAYTYGAAFEPGKKTLHGVVIHKPAFAQMIRRHQAHFLPQGITPSANPMEVLMAVNYNWQDQLGNGLLIGYPLHATEFFEAAMKETERIGLFLKRDFRAIPTYATGHKVNRFVYAVPPDEDELAEDREIRGRAAAILAEYKRRRDKYVGDGKPGVVELLRDWFHDGAGNYSARYAKVPDAR